MSYPKTIRMVRTEYRTNKDGAGYVLAKHLTTGNKRRSPWDHGLDIDANHQRAAELIFEREPEYRSAITGGGYLWGVDPMNDPVSRHTTEAEARDSLVSDMWPPTEYEVREYRGLFNIYRKRVSE